MNISALLTGLKATAGSVASHPITKGGSLAALITGGLAVASVAGVAVPELAFTLGPIAGVVLYKFLPPKVQQELDETTEKVVDLATTIPDVEASYPPSMQNKWNKSNIK